MCHPFSCIVMRGGKVHWSNKTDSHDELLYDNGLKDKDDPKLGMKFARVEITPDDGNYIDTPITDWVLNIDESIQPDWWSEKHERAARAALKKWYPEFIGKQKRELERQAEARRQERAGFGPDIVNGYITGGSQNLFLWVTSQNNPQVGIPEDISWHDYKIKHGISPYNEGHSPVFPNKEELKLWWEEHFFKPLGYTQRPKDW